MLKIRNITATSENCLSGQLPKQLASVYLDMWCLLFSGGPGVCTQYWLFGHLFLWCVSVSTDFLWLNDCLLFCRNSMDIQVKQHVKYPIPAPPHPQPTCHQMSTLKVSLRKHKNTKTLPSCLSRSNIVSVSEIWNFFTFKLAKSKCTNAIYSTHLLVH